MPNTMQGTMQFFLAPTLTSVLCLPCSHAVEKFPHQEDLHVFRIPPGIFVKLHEGTWHAGPLFTGYSACSFANLELADTNVVDHHTHIYADDGLQFEIGA